MCECVSGTVLPGFWRATIKSSEASEARVTLRVLDTRTAQIVEKDKEGKWVYAPNIYNLSAFYKFKRLVSTGTLKEVC